MFTWAASQMLSYSPFEWLLFVSVTLIATYCTRGWGIIVGHVVVALLVAWFDFQWVRAAMHAPGWDGAPDMDTIFEIGVLARIVLINTALLPLSLTTCYLCARRAKAAEPSVVRTREPRSRRRT